jgi:hypothetical protein
LAVLEQQVLRVLEVLLELQELLEVLVQQVLVVLLALQGQLALPELDCRALLVLRAALALQEQQVLLV